MFIFGYVKYHHPGLKSPWTSSRCEFKSGRSAVRPVITSRPFVKNLDQFRPCLMFWGRDIHRNIHFNAPMDIHTLKLEDFE